MPEAKVLDIDQIEESAVALRTEVDQKNPEYIGLRNSIKQYGLIDAIAVRRATSEDGQQLFTELGKEKYILLNGLQRKSAHQDLGMKQIACNIMSASEADALAIMIAANSIKVTTTKSQFAQALKQQMQMGGCTLEDLAVKNGKDKQWVLDQLSLNKLPSEVKVLLDNGSITLTNAVALARLPGEMILDHVNTAQTETAATFAPKIEAIVKEHRAALKEGRKMNTGFKPLATCRKPSEFKVVYEELTTKGVSSVLEPVIAGKTAPTEIAKAIFDWMLHMDPASIELQKSKYEAEEAAKAEKKAAKEAEKAKKQAEQAANAAGLETAQTEAPVTAA
jgi:ParB/RepB/Spo0J family partition protein